MIPSMVAIGECLIEFSPDNSGLFRMGFSGDVLNTSVCVKRICPEADVGLFTVVGNDHFSNSMIRFMEIEGLRIDSVLRDARRSSGLYIVSNTENGERQFSYWRDSSAARGLMKAGRCESFDADLLYLTGVTLAILDDEQRELLLGMVLRHRQKGGKVGFDPNFRDKLWENRQCAAFWCNRFYREADFALVGVDDHKGMLGVSSPDVIFEHVRMCGAVEIVVKKGPSGVSVYSESGCFELPARCTHGVVDTTGAGDAFNAGYLLKRMMGADPRKAALAGLNLSSVVISSAGGICERSAFIDRVREVSLVAD